MRQVISTLVIATFLTACGSAAAATRTASGPIVEDRSYDRIEELRSAKFTAQTDAWDRIEQLRLQRMLYPASPAGIARTSGLK